MIPNDQRREMCLFDYYNISPTEDITDKERAEYKMYADRLKAFLGSDSDNAQEANSSHNIENQINSASATSENKNSNTNKDKKKTNTDGAIHTSIQGGAGD